MLDKLHLHLIHSLPSSDLAARLIAQPVQRCSPAPPAWEALLVVKVEFMMLPVLVSPNTAPPFCPAVLLVKAVRMTFPARTSSVGAAGVERGCR